MDSPRTHTLSVYRTARYAMLGGNEPGEDARTKGETDLEEVWLACHGYGQLASYFLRPFRTIEAPHRLFVAPEGLSRFYLEDETRAHYRVGASWMTRDLREAEIADYVRLLDTVYADALARVGSIGARLTALGFSQGGATVTRWLAHSAMLGDPPAARLILWGSALPHDLDIAEHAAWLDRVQLTFVVGSDDAFVSPERLDEQRHALDEHGIAYEIIEYPGGHRIEEDVLRQLADR